MGRPAKTAYAEAERATLTDQLLNLVVAGRSIVDAAKQLELSYATAHRWYREALRRVYDDNATLREEVLGKELKTLDLLQRALWRGALSGHVRSVEVMLAVMDRRAKYLGLDAAVKIQVEATRVDDALAKISRIIDAEELSTPLVRAIPGAQ
jgi:hypothetical protein